MNRFNLLLIIMCIIAFHSCSQQSSLEFGCKVIAHRGCWNTSNGAENSLHALSEAIRIEVDGVELDICVTKDDSLVVAHGPKHGDYFISQTDFQILKKIKLTNGEVLPTFYDYLRYYKQLGANTELIVEIKHSDIEEKILKTLDYFNLSDKVKIISFGLDICKKIKMLNPNIPVCYLGGDKTPQEIKIASINGIAYNIMVFKENQQWLKDAKALGLITMIWTINDESDLKWSTQKEVDYIVTDYPIETMKFKVNCK